LFPPPPRGAPGGRIDENREETKGKQAEAENNELKTNTALHPVVFAYLAWCCYRASFGTGAWVWQGAPKKKKIESDVNLADGH
jgi:hypothetical protein